MNQHRHELTALIANLNLRFDKLRFEADSASNIGVQCRGLARALWEREGPPQLAGWMPFERVEAAFAHLSFSMIDDDKADEVPLHWARQQLGQHVEAASAILLASIGAGLLDQRDQCVCFCHPLIQAYFAALPLAHDEDLSDKITVPSFQYSWNRPQVKGQKPSAGKWDQAIVAHCGLASDASSIVQQVLNFNPFLAAECLASGITVPASLREEVVSVLLLLLHKQNVQFASVRYKGQIKANIKFVLGTFVALVLEMADQLFDFLGLLPMIIASPFMAADVVSGHRVGEMLSDRDLSAVDRAIRYTPIREAAAIALGEIGAETAIPGLMAALTDSNMWVRRAAAVALANTGQSGLAALQEAFQIEDPYVREAVVRGLGYTGEPLVAPLLLEAINMHHRLVNVAALDAIETLGVVALPGLIESLRDSTMNRRMAAGLALRKLEGIAVPALIEALTDEDAAVRQYAARLLYHIATPEAQAALAARDSK